MYLMTFMIFIRQLQEAVERKKEEEEDAADKAAEAEDTWGKLGETVSNFFGGGMCTMRKELYFIYLNQIWLKEEKNLLLVTYIDLLVTDRSKS